ncbi:heavy metal-binding domain-containing protein [Amylibacter sp.]|nr:heavy metal-binding domain-containing protein [Amylibacter sp.]
MAECKECNKTIKTWEVIGGKCDACFKWSERKKSEAQQELADQELEAIILTTETAPNLNIVSRVGIIMAEVDCSFTVKMVENNNALQSKLRSEAYSIGANAVVGITFNMIETYSATLGVSKVNTFKLIASGTAVVVEEINDG